MATHTETYELEKSESLKVFEWRAAVLEEAGLPERDAKRLASSHADLHAMVRAKHQGCTNEQLWRIFRDY